LGKMISFRVGLLLCCLVVSVMLPACAGGLKSQSGSRQPLYNYLDVFQDSAGYWNRDWPGNAAQFHQRLTGLVTGYVKQAEYAVSTNDCNDMAVSLWQILRDNGIYSLLAAGNLEKTNETFAECNHAWLVVYNGEGAAAAVEVTTGCIFLWEQVSTRPQLKQYWEAFLYPGPEEMRADFLERW